MSSKEADDWFTEKADRYYQTVIKPYIDNEVRKLNERIDREVQKLNDRITSEVNRLDNEVRILNDRITSEVNRLDGKTHALETALMKIINNLEGSGAWSGGLVGGLNNGRNLATGNINLFGGTTDGSSFIRTNNGKSENDLAGGV